MGNWWDFFKPDLASEYPSVDGPLTLHSYIGGLEQSYENYIAKEAKKAAKSSGKINGHANGNGEANGHSTTPEHPQSVKDFDYICFHGPYGKLVQKGTARLVSSISQTSLREEVYTKRITDTNALGCSISPCLVDVPRLPQEP